ncbi:hypothetical protein BN85402840 [Alteracholeplasma palmae J233]|uniref:HD-GYP domain-containing protein n=1 Tax=Alteracholeplasma palmae (strain ATCC 49389 / J233) TaxID=1318466 RepID=U4KR45_ALTPJ|nr:HD-GYP domain-containing protein [Alteracholeplasma palmae]CCV63861.1 hypothetical protein BN85402840 [Alteracholeplasma palmae J233]
MTIILYNLEEHKETLQQIISEQYKVLSFQNSEEIENSTHTNGHYIVVTTTEGKKEVESIFEENTLFLCVGNENKEKNDFFDVIKIPVDKEDVIEKIEKASYHLEYQKMRLLYEPKKVSKTTDELGLYTKKFIENYLKSTNKLENRAILVYFNLEAVPLLHKIYGRQTTFKALSNIVKQIKNVFPKLLLSRYHAFELVGTIIEEDYKEAEPLLSILSQKMIELEGIPLPIEIIIRYQYYKPGIDNPEEIIKTLRKESIETRRNHVLNDKTRYLSQLQETLESSNYESKDHINNLEKLTIEFMKELNLSEVEKKNLTDAVRLHDIGKLGIAKSILEKPSKLTEEEYNEIKKHPEYGYHIVLFEGFPVVIAKAILHHHERFDGMGYPAKLKGNKIPYLSRIIAILDSFEVMTRGRVYKASMSENEAINELERNKGTQFDPELVEKFIKVLKRKK